MFGLSLDFNLVFQLIFPLWCMNALYVLWHYVVQSFHVKDYPLDFNFILFDGNRLLGDAKTVGGLSVTVVCVALTLFLGGNMANELAVLCMSAFVGAVFGGFIKRRLGKQRGEYVFGLDQLDYFFAAYVLLNVFSFDYYNKVFFTALVINFFLHVLSTYCAFLLGIRPRPF